MGEGMQKKIWWCCAVCAAVAVFAINLAADYTVRHPESKVGTYFIKAYDQNASVVYAFGKPFRAMREAGLIARDTLSSLKKDDAQGIGNENSGRSCIADPTPMTAESCPTAVTPERLPGSIRLQSDNVNP